MSIQTQNPMNDAARQMIKDLFGEPVYADERTNLYNKALEMNREQMTRLANAAKQVIEVEVNDVGDIKEMSDGQRYRCTEKGWVKY